MVNYLKGSLNDTDMQGANPATFWDSVCLLHFFY